MGENLQSRIAETAPPPPPPPPDPPAGSDTPVISGVRLDRGAQTTGIYSLPPQTGPAAGDMLCVFLVSRGVEPTAYFPVTGAVVDPEWTAGEGDAPDGSRFWDFTPMPFNGTASRGTGTDRVDIYGFYRIMEADDIDPLTDYWWATSLNGTFNPPSYDLWTLSVTITGGTLADLSYEIDADGDIADVLTLTNSASPTDATLMLSAAGIAALGADLGSTPADPDSVTWTGADTDPFVAFDSGFLEGLWGSNDITGKGLTVAGAGGIYSGSALPSVELDWAGETLRGIMVTIALRFSIEGTPSVAASSGGTRQGHRGLPKVHWTLSGAPIDLAEWSPNSTAGGYEQCRGTLPERQLLRLPWSGQGDTLRGEDAEGNVVWEGRLSSPPYRKYGMGFLAAQGEKYRAVKRTSRLFVQSRDMSIWQATDSEPHLNGTGGAVYDHYRHIDVGGKNRLAFKVDKDQALASGSANGYVFYAEGIDLKRVAFWMNYDASDETSNLVIRLQRADGPTGAESNVNTWATTSGNNGDEKDETMGSVNDLVILELKVDSDFTPSNAGAYRLSLVRVNSDICLTDTFNAYEIAAYMGAQLGWDTSGVIASTFNSLPFDWEGDWASGLDYLADSEDKFWRVTDDRNGLGPLQEYDEFGATNWTVYTTDGADPGLTPLEVFDEVIVHYTSPTGVSRRAVAASTTLDVGNTFEYELNDRQADSTYATAVAERLLARYSTVRLAGPIEIAAAYNDAGVNAPYGIQYGDTVTIADFDAGQSKRLRVMEAAYEPGRVRVGSEQPINIATLLHGKRVHHRRHKKKGHHG